MYISLTQICKRLSSKTLTHQLVKNLDLMGIRYCHREDLQSIQLLSLTLKKLTTKLSRFLLQEPNP